MSFEQLPLDLLAEILHFEDVPTLKHLCQVDSKFRTVCNNESLWKNKFVELTQIQNPGNHSIPNTLARTWLDRVRLFWILTHPKTVMTMVLSDSTIKNYITNSIKTAEACATQNWSRGSMIFEPHLAKTNYMGEIKTLIHHSIFYENPFFNFEPSNTSLTLMLTAVYVPVFTVSGNDRNLIYELIFVFYKYPSILNGMSKHFFTGLRTLVSKLNELRMDHKKIVPQTFTVKDIETLLTHTGGYKIVEMPIAQCPYRPGPENIGLVSPVQLQRESFPTFKPALSPEFVASRVRVAKSVRVLSPSPRPRSGRQLPSPPPLVRPVFPPPYPRLFQLQRFLPDVPQLALPPLPTQPPIRFRR